VTIDRTQLNAEIKADPRAYGYATHVATGADTLVAALLNTKRAEIVVATSAIPVGAAAMVMDKDEFSLLTQMQLLQLQVILGAVSLSGGAVIPGSAPAHVIKDTIFPAASFPKTNAAFTSLETRSGSRAEELFGTGAIVTSDDVAKALRG
jgi:hypothetical protein